MQDLNEDDIDVLSTVRVEIRRCADRGSPLGYYCMSSRLLYA